MSGWRLGWSHCCQLLHVYLNGSAALYSCLSSLQGWHRWGGSALQWRATFMRFQRSNLLKGKMCQKFIDVNLHLYLYGLPAALYIWDRALIKSLKWTRSPKRKQFSQNGVGPLKTHWVPTIGLSVPNVMRYPECETDGSPQADQFLHNEPCTQKWIRYPKMDQVPKNGSGTQKQTHYPKIDWVPKNGLCPHKESQVATFC